MHILLPELLHELPSSAWESFQRADELGHWRAPYALAALFQDGQGIDRNITKALELYRKLFRERTRSVTVTQSFECCLF